MNNNIPIDVVWKLQTAVEREAERVNKHGDSHEMARILGKYEIISSLLNYWIDGTIVNLENDVEEMKSWRKK